MHSGAVLLLLCLARRVTADLRIAAHEWPGYRCHWPNAASMKNMHCKYMMPANFSYQGLELQSFLQHDQFVRSNIDNEHDNRNFRFEEGKDALPFRTDEGEVRTHYILRRKVGGKLTITPNDLKATVAAGSSMLVPLRWNNPHSSEVEVNVWILDGEKPVVVPIRKPTCSGEGYQDNIIRFTVPADFATLGERIPGFRGCNADTKPMCVLQIYAHSVESRTYATSFPIVVTGHQASRTTASNEAIQNAASDPKMEGMSSLRDLCRQNTDPSADIQSAVPRWGRLVSDVYNHAYQNSDFSPYSGQQHESISKNLQASCINKMVTGNRGELGRSILPEATYSRLKALRTLETKIFKNYESLANKIIKSLGSDMISTGTIEADGTKQQLANCFRCAAVGSIRTKRLETSTYIPSFELPTGFQQRAKQLLPPKYEGLISSSGQVQIYVAAMTDMFPFLFVSQPYGILYQDAMLKPTLATKKDATGFQKNRGSRYSIDKGEHASTMAKREFALSLGCPEKCLECQEGAKPLIKKASATCITGDCSKCALMFDNHQISLPPMITSLASDIASSGLPKGMGKDQVVSYPDSDGSFRFGRPPQPGEEPAKAYTIGWELRKPKASTTQAPTQTPTIRPPDSDAPSARRRRGGARRRSKGSGGSGRRRSGSTRRRRRSKDGQRRRRGARRRRRRSRPFRPELLQDAGLEQLLQEVVALQAKQL